MNWNRILILTLAVIFSGSLLSKDINKSFFGNVAIEGYDPVAYFTEGTPVKGNSDFEYFFDDAKWRFSSAQNKKLFIDNPRKYIPQYGGYCAFAMNLGEKYKISPEYWSIHNGKLYLNYNSDVQEKWLKEKESMIENADKNWKSLEQKN